MTKLDQLYIQFLHLGLLVLREAIASGDTDWANAEVELLHNVPSLIGETNAARHEYFWLQERTSYIGWTSASGREYQRSRMRTYYEPIWREIETLILKQSPGSATDQRTKDLTTDH
jgi:hypothetical protein